jgi:hypothetical protein
MQDSGNGGTHRCVEWPILPVWEAESRRGNFPKEEFNLSVCLQTESRFNAILDRETNTVKDKEE